MPGGFTNKPKILRGAFVEYGLSIPPLVVVFQFNPIQLTRNHSLYHEPPNNRGQDTTNELEYYYQSTSLRNFHLKNDDLLKIRDEQVVTIQEETINFEIRLDASDKLNEGDPLAEQFGIGPQIATLELMVSPKDESLMGKSLPNLKTKGGFSFTKSKNPPLILFIWGRHRVLPVNINSLNITETDFSTELNPIRATIAVNLSVIEGENKYYTLSKLAKERMSSLYANVTEVANVIIPG